MLDLDPGECPGPPIFLDQNWPLLRETLLGLNEIFTRLF